MNTTSSVPGRWADGYGPVCVRISAGMTRKRVSGYHLGGRMPVEALKRDSRAYSWLAAR